MRKAISAPSSSTKLFEQMVIISRFIMLFFLHYPGVRCLIVGEVRGIISKPIPIGGLLNIVL